MATVLFDGAQMRGWKVVVDAVHARGGKIVVQLMQTGRVAHVANLPPGAEVIAPTAEMCPGEMDTDSHGMQPHSPPRAMTSDDITRAVEEHVHSARLAIEAGFDGVELHAANVGAHAGACDRAGLRTRARVAHPSKLHLQRRPPRPDRLARGQCALLRPETPDQQLTQQP